MSSISFARHNCITGLLEVTHTSVQDTLRCLNSLFLLQESTNFASHRMSVIESLHKSPTLPKCSIFEYLFGQGDSYPTPNPDGPAFIDGFTGRSLTRAEVGLQARRLASGIMSLGVKRGDVMCIFGMNSHEWINALLGGQAAGLVVSPASYG